MRPRGRNALERVALLTSHYRIAPRSLNQQARATLLVPYSGFMSSPIIGKIHKILMGFLSTDWRVARPMAEKKGAAQAIIRWS